MLLSKEEAWYGLCENCQNELVPKPDNLVLRCDQCGRPLISEIDRCLPCRAYAETEPPSYDRLVSLFPYMGRFINLLSSFKYQKSLGTGHFLARQLIDALKLLPLHEMENPVLVPVPPRPGKIRKTGWDQIVCLSKILKQMDAPFPVQACLVRRVSQTQKKLDRKDRRLNLKGRIIAKGKAPKECILFDDVITTGSTINACAAALKANGAETVFGVCLFYD